MAESLQELSEGQCYVALTHDHLDAKAIMDRVRSPKAGAIVLFAGMLPPLKIILSNFKSCRYWRLRGFFG